MVLGWCFPGISPFLPMGVAYPEAMASAAKQRARGSECHQRWPASECTSWEERGGKNHKGTHLNERAAKAILCGWIVQKQTNQGCIQENTDSQTKCPFWKWHVSIWRLRHVNRRLSNLQQPAPGTQITPAAQWLWINLQQQLIAGNAPKKNSFKLNGCFSLQ